MKVGIIGLGRMSEKIVDNITKWDYPLKLV